MSRRVRIAATAAGVACALLLATGVWPGLRGPESWRWARRVALSPWLLAVIALFAATAVAAGRAARAWAEGPGRARAGWLGAAVALVLAQMIALTAAEPGGLSNVERRVRSASFTSYDTIARGVDDPRDFLRRYDRIQGSFPVHGPSQPPGRVLYFWAARKCLGDEAGPAAAGFLLMAIGAAALVPLVFLVGGRHAPQAVGASILLMGSLPAYLLFTPQTDHLVLLLSLTAAACLVEAMRYASARRAGGLALAAGAAAGAGVLVSFTTLAALAAWGCAALGMLLAARQRRVPFPTGGQAARIALAAAAGFAIVPGAAAALGLDWPAVFRESTAAAHRVQVLIQGRDYATWVVWNLADFALFLGPPLVVVWITRVRAEWRDGAAEIPFAGALLVAIAALDVSGRILGETGRIWMFLMPLAVGAAALGVRRVGDALPLAAAQALVLLALRAFVNVPG